MLNHPGRNTVLAVSSRVGYRHLLSRKSYRMSSSRQRDPNSESATKPAGTIFTQHTLTLSHHPTIITQQRGHTVSTETKSWSDSSPPRPKSFFSGPRRRPSLSNLSMVLIEFTTFEEHFGSAASRMTSMYSQFVRTACVTAGKSGYSIQFSAS